MRKKVGLALSAGGPAALAFHMGLLRHFENNGIGLDLIAGSSAGCLPAILYGLDMSVEEGIAWLRDKSISSYMRLDWGNDMAFLSYQGFVSHLKTLVGKKRLEQLRVPIGIVLVELETGKKIVLREGEIVDIAKMIFSLPGMFSPVNRNGKYLVDGALIEPIPVDTAREMGADIVIAVNGNSKGHVESINREKLPSRRKVLDRILPQGLLNSADMKLMGELVSLEQKNFIEYAHKRSNAEIKIDLLSFMITDNIQEISIFHAQDFQYYFDQWAAEAADKVQLQLEKMYETKN